MARHPPAEQPTGSEDAIVVLGCRVRDGAPSAALERRLAQAGQVHQASPQLPVVMSGGKRWEGHMEAEVMGLWWKSQGSQNQLFLEGVSQTTRENAEQVAQLCQRMGYRHLILVTCDFHMKRARKLFERQQLVITASPARANRSATERTKLAFREWGASALSRWESLVR